MPEEIFEQWWSDRLKGDRKKVTEASLGALLAKARVPRAAVSPGRLSAVLLNRGNPGPLTRKDGTIIRGVSGTAATMTPMAVVPHRNHKGETIGFKLATESFSREELWTTQKTDKAGKLVVNYYRRLIPHPRGLKNLALRTMQSTGEQLTWSRPLADAEITELGLDGNAAVKALRRGHQKALMTHAKLNRKGNAAELALSGPPTPAAAPVPPIFSLRKIFTGLPPNARRLRNSHGTDISRLANGDLLRVPLTRDGEICEPGEPPYREYWYRVVALKTNGQIQLVLAERKQPKALTERDLKQGKKPDSQREWLRKAAVKQPGSDPVIAFLLRHTRADDKPPDTRK